MKIKIKNVAIIFLLISTAVKSQSNFNYGIKIGLSNSSIYFTDKTSDILDENFEGNSLNPTMGLFINYSLNNFLTVETELSYLQKGSRKTIEVNRTTEFSPEVIGTYELTYGIDVRYLEFGLNIKPTMEINSTPIYLILGSSLNFTLNAMHLDQDRVNNIICSYKIGLGLQLNDFIKSPIIIEIKYIRDFKNFYSIDYGKLWNEVFLFNMGIEI